MAALLPLAGCAKVKKEPPAPISVKSYVDRSTVAIGDKIKYTVLIEKDKDVEVEPLVFGENLGDFAIKDFGSRESSFLGREKISQWYVLDTYVTGKTTIPRALIKYRNKGEKEWSRIETGEIPIDVKSLLEGAGKPVEMRDIKGPASLPSVINKYTVFAVALLILCLALGVYLYILRKGGGEKYVLRKSAHQIAYEQLEALKAKDLIGRGLIKEYYTEISDIVRRYLEDRFRFRAPEMTTEEFLSSARDAAELERTHKDLLKEFLLCCDLVKFAKYAPSQEEVSAIFDSAKKFIDQTKENEPA